MHLLKYCFTVLLLSTAFFTLAQKPAPVKWKAPKVTTTLGTVKDTVILQVEEATALIAVPLKITDDKKTNFPVVSYQCLYRRKGVTENEETGKTSPITTVVAQTFKTTPLSPLWIKIITEQLKSGEEVYFFDVVTKDAQGKFFFAPNLLIKVK